MAVDTPAPGPHPPMSSIHYWVGPFSKNELSISFDEQSAKAFAHSIKNHLNADNPCAFHTRRVHSGNVMASRMVIELAADEASEFIHLRKHQLTLALSEDAIEYAIFKLDDFMKTGDFSPAEYTTIQSLGKKNVIRLYFTRHPAGLTGG